MANTTNFGWETPDDTDLVKDGALAMRTLGNAIDTSLVDLKGGTTGQILSKNSNTDLDYTWINNDQGDITEVQAGTGISVASGTGPIPVVTNTVATTFDAKGDLVVGTGADTFAKLTVGTNGYTLISNSAESTGLQWKVRPDFIGCAVYTINASVAFTSGTAKVINYGSEDYDTNSFHDNSTNNSRITIPTGLGGKYNISALIRTEDSVGNLYSILGLLKNGSDFNSLGIPSSVVKGDDQGTVAMVYTVQVSLAAADYVEFSFQSNWATGNKTITSRFCVEYLGA